MDLKSRLNSVIQKDKKTNPNYITKLIKSDFFYLISNYFEVDFEDINIAVNLEEDKYKIDISCLADRIKLMKTMP